VPKFCHFVIKNGHKQHGKGTFGKISKKSATFQRSYEIAKIFGRFG
jgi:hypothetical protein